MEEPVPERGEAYWTGFTPEYVKLTVEAPGARQGELRRVTVTEEML